MVGSAAVAQSTRMLALRLGGSEGRWVGGPMGRCAGVLVGRWADGPVCRWADHTVSLQHSVTSATVPL